MSVDKKNIYMNFSKKLKVLSDPKRLEIIDLLSCRELCACEILEYFHITQPTLSNHMKKLEEASFTKSRREGKNIYYTLNEESFKDIRNFIEEIFTSTEDCICNKDF
ncbi:MAG: metalloregulator ArsR/SmtB family transcription factor [Peptoniphilus sp.]|uniref:ArsR/SmtB family transcription factor n=1 Tax=Peptoniphilus sp. TaxID=1971214 RepID=UPI0025DC5FF5|nr:metalloregulator ArsR/SmtB family transcription factor [Peptoniphilus sp.]MCI5643150.1 metalloregulator ArsR/SmtB family transcription factor [Peptoniphilus sp.]MDD7352277.1 metalloregulator ArsR/SmtB family transcription factor [Peptoniphilaceae bacterium]MDY3902907.1 metalloregulator ArsR/SmtB family transcription factor [Peptoniphilus sp.]